MVGIAVDRVRCGFIGGTVGLDPQGRCKTPCRFNPFDADVVPQTIFMRRRERVAHCEAVVEQPAGVDTEFLCQDVTIR